MNVHQHLTLEDKVDDDVEDTVDDDVEDTVDDDVKDTVDDDVEDVVADDDVKDLTADDVEDVVADDDVESTEEENMWRRLHIGGGSNGLGINIRANWNTIQRAHWLLTVHFLHSYPVTRLEEDFAMRALNAYFLENTPWKRLVIGYERCPSTRRFHAHVYLATERTVRMTRSLRSISLRVIPDLKKPLRPHINYLDGPSDIINVIYYVVKKETKVRGGVLGKDTFIFAKDAFVESVLGGGPSPHPLASSLSTAPASTHSSAMSSSTQAKPPASPLRTPSPLPAPRLTHRHAPRLTHRHAPRLTHRHASRLAHRPASPPLAALAPTAFHLHVLSLPTSDASARQDTPSPAPSSRSTRTRSRPASGNSSRSTSSSGTRRAADSSATCWWATSR